MKNLGVFGMRTFIATNLSQCHQVNDDLEKHVWNPRTFVNLK